MTQAIVQSPAGVTLVGAGALTKPALAAALALAPRLVAADGGADRALALGHAPEAVIGDLDSLTPAARTTLPPDRLYRIDEQETTDFDKALRHVSAPFVLGLGFWGPRFDHGLAALNTLARHPDRACILLGGSDLCFLAPRDLTLHLRKGSRLSLFPLAPVKGESAGLEWPIEGLEFAPDGRVGTSNRVVAGEVRLSFSAPRMLVILPRGQLAAAVRALAPGALPAPVRGG
ncbi:thiamine diphosphokinase [Acidimangrovimonas pyrenivorans]|uniref:Thiamine diphosphokinase n=1 Tax=Acidimangrovimonas pyrenivorans TaxID=2030798 RepID=A0ABV7ACR9_9RHOB